MKIINISFWNDKNISDRKLTNSGTIYVCSGKVTLSLNLNLVCEELKAWHNGSLGILDAAKNKAGSDELEDCSVVGQAEGMWQCGPN